MVLSTTEMLPLKREGVVAHSFNCIAAFVDMRLADVVSDVVTHLFCLRLFMLSNLFTYLKICHQLSLV